MKQAMVYSHVNSRPILKINKIKGLKDPKWGCSFEPFDFFKADEGRQGNPENPIDEKALIAKFVYLDQHLREKLAKKL